MFQLKISSTFLCFIVNNKETALWWIKFHYLKNKSQYSKLKSTFWASSLTQCLSTICWELDVTWLTVVWICFPKPARTSVQWCPKSWWEQKYREKDGVWPHPTVRCFFSLSGKYMSPLPIKEKRKVPFKKKELDCHSYYLFMSLSHMEIFASTIEKISIC